MIKEEYLYKNTHLPKEGWLQGCFRCYTITGNTHLHKINKYTNTQYLVYLCPHCHKKMNATKKKKKRYNLLFEKYIFLKHK